MPHEETITMKQEIQPRKWYRMATGPGSTRLVSPIALSGRTVQVLSLGQAGKFVPSEQGYDAIAEDGHAVHDLTARDLDRPGIGGIQGPVDDLPDLTDSDIEALRGKYRQKLAKEKADREVASEAKTKHMDGLPSLFPWLVPLVKNPKSSHYAAGAKNCKRDLSHTFRVVKFSCKSDSFSMGCSIHASWEDGPSVSEADKIVDRYCYSGFDSMQDLSYTLDDTAHSDVFGGAKYASSNRSMSDATRAVLTEWAEERYEQNDTYDACDVANLAYRLFAASSLPGGAVVTGVERKEDETCGLHQPSEWWRIVYDAPEQPAPPQARKATPHTTEEQTGGVTISQHTHTKKGFEMWIVTIADRVSKERFMELLARAREDEGWYSRPWNGTPGGFAFKDEEKAKEFAGELV